MNTHASAMTDTTPTDAPALDRLLRARSIVIVGVSEGRSMGRVVLMNLQRFAYAGDIHLVSRSSTRAEGLPCVASLEEVPDGVDVAVLAIPAAGMLAAVEQCGRKHFGAVVVFASGYAETGEQGRAQQDLLAQAAHRSGLLLVGPNSMGLTNYADGVPLTFESVRPLNASAGQGIALLSQSGAMANNMRDAFSSRHLRVSCSVGTGNEAGLCIEDYLEHLLADARTGVVAVYAEQVRQPQRFLALAARAREAGKPIVMLMPGRSARAQAAALSHTGAIVSNHATACAMLRRQAVVLVDTLDELLDTAALLCQYPNPPGGGVAFATNSGAVKNVALDFADAAGIDMPALAAESVERLKALLPDYAVAENPLDYTTANAKDPALMGKLLQVLDADPHVGCVVLAAMAGAPLSQRDKTDHLLPAMAAMSKTAVLVILGDSLPLEPFFAEAIERSRVPTFRSTDRALRAVANLGAYRKALDLAPRCSSGRLVPTLLPAARTTLAEYESKALLAQAGLPVPVGGLATDVDAALQVAERVGYPVVLKAQSPLLMHKSEAGGVVLGLRNAQELREGWARLQGNVARARPELALDGVLVEAMGAAGVELVVGAKRDPDWGPLLIVGLGGIWIETLKDVRLIPVDMCPDDVAAELLRLKAAPLLQGARGALPVDLDAVAQLTSSIGALMRAHPRIAEIDINPVMAQHDGVCALDALIVLDEPRKAANEV